MVFERGLLNVGRLRMDSTVVKSNIASPSDSQLLSDGCIFWPIIDYGHKINLATDNSGLISVLMIEKGNPSDTERFVPVIKTHQVLYGCVPMTTIADGGISKGLIPLPLGAI